MESSSQSLFSGYTFLFSMFVDQLMKLFIYMGHQVFSELRTPVYDCLVNISNKAPPGLPDFECARQVLNCPSKLLFADVFLSQMPIASVYQATVFGAVLPTPVCAQIQDPWNQGDLACFTFKAGPKPGFFLPLSPTVSLLAPQVTPRSFSDLFQSLPGLC